MKEMKDKFKEKSIPDFYRSHLLYQLYYQCNIYVEDYMIRSDDLTLRCDARED